METLLDLRGLKCTLPALKTARALASLAPEAALVVICTDPLAAVDIPNTVRESGALLEGESRDGVALIFRIRKL